MKLRTSCLACRKHTNNVGSRKTIMINKAIRDKSKCAICNNEKSRFMKLNHSKKKWPVIL